MAAGWRRLFRWEHAPAGLSLVVVAGLVIYPLLILLVQSFQMEKAVGVVEITLDNYLGAFRGAAVQKAIGNTLVVSGGATLVALFFGLPTAWIATRTDIPGLRILEPLNLVPFFLSPFVGAIAWSYLASPKVGMLNVWLQGLFGLESPPFNIYSLAGMMWVLGIFFTPYIYLFVVGSLRHMDPTLEESARLCGAGLLSTTLRVTLPLVTPAIISGVIIVFVSSAGEFGVPLALGSPVSINILATELYKYLQTFPPLYGQASATGIVLLLVTGALVIVQRRVIMRRSYVTVSGRGYRARRVSLGRWRMAALGFNIFYLVVAVGIPLLSLGLVSVSRGWTGYFDPARLTLDNYHFVLLESDLTRRALSNSLMLSVVGAAVGMILATVIAIVSHRGKGAWRGVLDVVVTLPVGVPGVVLAVAFLIAFIRTPLYGTIWLLLVAYVARFLPYGHKNVVGTLLSISPEMEECARTCGASWLRAFVRIIMPLLKPGLMAGWLLLFIIFMREVPISVLLAAPGNEVIAMALFSVMAQKPPPTTTAFAMVQVAVLLVAVFAFVRLAGTEDITV